MDSDLEELIKLVEEITVIVHDDYYPLPHEKMNQRDVLKKRINKRLKERDKDG